MFETKAELHPNYCPSTSIYNWRSKKTGLDLVLVRCPTPAVNGYFAVASEIDNDAGFPHTLEHLVFMGSDTWPYKGFLDILGNKLLSSTNAWTGKDQTVYTLSTAGWEGFAGMLPVYLDHILHPKITKSTCLTEVYHIDGAGQERGVVFSEMQGVENTPFSLIASELHILMYGKGHPYASNTGGLLDALRVITHEQIQEYHSKVYSPRNLSVIVTGQVEPEELLDVMNRIEEQLGDVPPMDRPFSSIDPAPPLPETIIHKMEFPESDETFGEVQIGWFGTSSDDIIGYEAIEVLDYFFTSESTGILQKALVEIENPLCSSISLDTDDYKVTLVSLTLSCVPTERLEEVDGAIMKVFKDMCDPKNIDMGFMKDTISSKRSKFILNVENDPAAFAYMAIDNFLYGAEEPEIFKYWSGEVDVYALLAEWSADDWAKFISKYFVQPNHVTVLGSPSSALEKQVKQEKKERAAQIKRDYNIDELAKQIADAKEENEAPVPVELLDRFPVPDLTKIHYIATESATWKSTPTNTELQRYINKDGEKSNVGFNMQFESHSSQFITVKVYFNSHLLDSDLLPYIDILLVEQIAFGMKLDDGTYLTAEEIGLEISRDTLVARVSTNGMLQELVMVDARFKRENYNKVITWIERAIFNVVYEPERVQLHIKKFLASVSEEKREGSSVITASVHEYSTTRESLRRQSEALLVEDFFKEALNNIPKVIDDMKRLCKQLFVPHNARILVSGDISALSDPVSAWDSLYSRISANNEPKPLAPVPFSNEYMTDLGKNPQFQSIITLCPTDSSYMTIVSKGPTDYLHEHTPALTLLNVYLGVTEGPLWREVRGEGLAYGARIIHRQELGYIICEFYSASDPVAAYKTTRNLLHNLARGEDEFDDREIQGAITGFVSALALDQSTTSSAIIQKYFDSTLKSLGDGYVQRLVAKVSRVTKAELLMALKKYLLPLFEPETSAVFTVCHGSEAEPIKEFFNGLNFTVTVNNILDDSESDEDQSEDESEDESGDSDSD